jgi:hypothetical protein
VNRVTLSKWLERWHRNLPSPTPEQYEREFRWGPDAWTYHGFESDAFRTA